MNARPTFVRKRFCANSTNIAAIGMIKRYLANSVWIGTPKMLAGVTLIPRSPPVSHSILRMIKMMMTLAANVAIVR